MKKWIVVIGLAILCILRILNVALPLPSWLRVLIWWGFLILISYVIVMTVIYSYRQHRDRRHK